MKLNIRNEFAPLKKVVVCWGNNVPIYEDYKTDDPEFTKFHPYSWDNDLLLKQQEAFFKLLEKYGVELVFPKTAPHLLWQMYTRDTAFVVGDKLYYSNVRKMEARNGEIEGLLEVLELENTQIVPLEGEIEGGDVLVSESGKAYVGHSSRKALNTIKELQNHVDTKVFELGKNVMHLDTRLTLLPQKIALVTAEAFVKEDLEFIQSKYKCIDVTTEETKKLGTNVFCINPETVVVPIQHKRVGELIKEKGLMVEYIDYTEPINLGGSFRCTTMPLVRE